MLAKKSLDDLNTVFDLLRQGKSIRSVVHYQIQDTMVGELPGEIIGEDQPALV